MSDVGPGSDWKCSLQRSEIETSLGPGCRCGNGSPRNLEMFPKTGVEYGPYPRNHRIGWPMLSPIHDLTEFHHCLVGPELQEHAEVQPCLLGLSADTFFLVDHISGVFRDGKLYLLTDYERPS